jgi:hypothetical protein
MAEMADSPWIKQEMCSPIVALPPQNHSSFQDEAAKGLDAADRVDSFGRPKLPSHY